VRPFVPRSHSGVVAPRDRFAGFLIARAEAEPMDRTDALFAASLGITVLGLVSLVYGELARIRTFVFVGSVLVVVAVGLLTGVIAGLDEPDGHGGAH